MKKKDNNVKKQNSAISLLLELLAVEGGSGEEGQIADFIIKRLHQLGVPKAQIKVDSSHKKIAGFTQGNVIVTFPGRRNCPRVLFSAHMDTVPLCRGAVPKLNGKRIVSAGATGLGADNRTGVAALIQLAEHLQATPSIRPPVTLLFTVGEEVGLCGAKEVSLRSLGNPAMAFNYDGGDPARVVVGAIGADRLTIRILGRSAHAGMHPDHGVSAGIIAARALAWLEEQGWHGAVEKGRSSGCSNVGSMEGGEATNQVMDSMVIRAETRSHRIAFLDRMTATWQRAFEKAANSQKSSLGQSGKAEFSAIREYLPFTLPRSSPVVKRALAAVRDLDLEPSCQIINGGLDANPLNAKGLPTVTLGAGQHGAHTVDEYVDVEEYLKGCQLAQKLCGA